MQKPIGMKRSLFKPKNEGNALFKNAKWVEAIEKYTEAIKRSPKNHVAFSNRAACYAKLMDWQRALDDCDQCIKIEPKFTKAYIRKGRAQRVIKQYDRALATFEQGLKVDPTHKDLLEDKRQIIQIIEMENSSGNISARRRQEAMKNPEIQQILQDPVIMEVLRNAGGGPGADPAAAQRSMNDPAVAAKIKKLVDAGVISLGGARQ